MPITEALVVVPGRYLSVAAQLLSFIAMPGAIVGDIVGSVYEFDNHRSKNFPLFARIQSSRMTRS